jgi:hypothetical protein
VRDLTAALADRLNAVSPTYRSWVQASELREIAAIVDREVGVTSDGGVDLARLEETATCLAEAEASGRRREQMEVLRQAYVEYRRDLELIGLSDEQVSDGDHPGRRRLAVAWAAARVVAALPAAAVGAVVHVVPYRVMKRVGTVPGNESVRTTVKLLGCFVLFTLVYTAIGVLVAERWGPWAGLAAAVGAPACGYATVRLAERVKRIGGVMAGARVMRQRRAVLATVLDHRSAVVAAAAAVLCADWDHAGPERTGSGSPPMGIVGPQMASVRDHRPRGIASPPDTDVRERLVVGAGAGIAIRGEARPVDGPRRVESAPGGFGPDPDEAGRDGRTASVASAVGDGQDAVHGDLRIGVQAGVHGLR